MGKLQLIRAKLLCRSLLRSPYTRCDGYRTDDGRTAGSDLRSMAARGKVYNVQTKTWIQLDVRVLKALQRLERVARKRRGLVHINCLSNGFHSGGAYPSGCHPRGKAADVDSNASRRINFEDVRTAFGSTGCTYVIVEAGHWHGSWR